MTVYQDCVLVESNDSSPQGRFLVLIPMPFPAPPLKNLQWT